jgi:polyisoprenoid-binding protein YceI
MKTFIAALAAGLALGGEAAANPKSTDPAKVPAGTYVLDKHHASLTAKVAHLGGFSRFTLRFDRLDGGFTYDPATWQTTPVRIAIDAASADSGNPALDKEIGGFLDAKRFPQITFASRSLSVVDGAQAKLTGDLTLHGVTRPVTLDVTFNGVGPGLTGLGTRLGFSGVARIKRSDFGVTSMSQWVGDDVDLLIEVEFEKASGRVGPSSGSTAQE